MWFKERLHAKLSMRRRHQLESIALAGTWGKKSRNKSWAARAGRRVVVLGQNE